jgi:hypothetical protein
MMLMMDDENNRQIQRELARLERLKIGSIAFYKHRIFIMLHLLRTKPHQVGKQLHLWITPTRQRRSAKEGKLLETG